MNIMVVDDHPLVLEGLQMILSNSPFEVTAHASTMETAVKVHNETNPDLTLVDIRLGGDNGLDFIEKVKTDKRQGKFAVFSSDGSKENFERAQALDVDGYILKDAFPEEVVFAINLIEKGRKYYDPKVMEEALKKKDDVQVQLGDITPREYDILVELGNGLSNKRIADKLYISEYTVKKHVSRILFKLELEDRTQAALFANKYQISCY